MKPHHTKIWLSKFLEIMDQRLGKEKVDQIGQQKFQDPLDFIKALTKEFTQDESTEISFLLMNHMTEHVSSDELVQSVEAGDGITIVDIPDVKAKAAAGQMVYFTSFSMRNGIAMAMSEIEHNLFPPKEKSNDLFEYYMAKVPPSPDGIPMVVFGVPTEYEKQVRGIIESHGLKIKEDGYTMKVFGNGEHEFKFGGKNIFPLENVSDHKCYKNSKDAAEEDAARSKAEADFLQTQRIIQEHAQKEKAQRGDQAPQEKVEES